MKLRGEFEFTGVTTVVMDRSRAWQKSIMTDGVWVKSSVPCCFEYKDVMAGSTELSAADLRARIQQMADEGAKVWQSGNVLNIYTKKFQRLWTFDHPFTGVRYDEESKKTIVVVFPGTPKAWRKRGDEELAIYDAAVAKKAAEARECERAFEELLAEANDEMCKVAVHEACAACEHKTATVKTPLGDVNFNIGIGRCRPRATYFDGHTTYDLGVRSVNIGGLVRDGCPPATINLEGWIEGERKPLVSASNPVFDRDTLMREMVRSPMFLHR